MGENCERKSERVKMKKAWVEELARPEIEASINTRTHGQKKHYNKAEKIAAIFGAKNIDLNGGCSSRSIYLCVYVLCDRTHNEQ